MKLAYIEPKFVELMPPLLSEGMLYISMIYATAVHLCACGCGNKVVSPLSPAEWHMFFDGEAVWLTPSVGSWEFPCKSHYWIEGNKIKWAAPWTDAQIAAGRQRDAEDLESYFAGGPTANGWVWETDSKRGSKRGGFFRNIRRRFTR